MSETDKEMRLMLITLLLSTIKNLIQEDPQKAIDYIDGALSRKDELLGEGK